MEASDGEGIFDKVKIKPNSVNHEFTSIALTCKIALACSAQLSLPGTFPLLGRHVPHHITAVVLHIGRISLAAMQGRIHIETLYGSW